MKLILIFGIKIYRKLPRFLTAPKGYLFARKHVYVRCYEKSKIVQCHKRRVKSMKL